METLCSYKPCYCNNTFCLEGEYFLEGEIYLFEKINSGVWSIDDMGVTEVIWVLLILRIILNYWNMRYVLLIGYLIR